MSISITPIAGTTRLAVSGDIDAIIEIPHEARDLGRNVSYAIALSDGTMLRGAFGEDRAHRIVVAVEGAGLVRDVPGGVAIDWAVEWLTVAPDACAIVPARRPASLPLFPQLAA